MSKSELIACFQDTLAKCNSPKLRDLTEQAKQGTVVYKENFSAEYGTGILRDESQVIEVLESTSFAAAKKYIQYGKVGVLNFANPHNPGGGVVNGAMAQEECLCRSSNLYPCLNTEIAKEEYYNYNKEKTDYFFSDRIIYSNDVTVFKTDDSVPVLMPEDDWFKVSVITCAAPYLAKRENTNEKALKELFKRRIKNIFEVALENGISVLILGAFGCGAFKNPPTIVASAFHEVIEQENYEWYFKKIIFAIKSTVSGNSSEVCPNIAAFEQTLCSWPAGANEIHFGDSRSSVQATGSMKLPSGKFIKDGEQLNLYRQWQSRNKYFGKQFSILGDSISTLEGYNPNGYSLFYIGEACDRSGVRNRKDTWWGKVIDYFDGELLVNNSWSGSCVAKSAGSDTLFPSGCSKERTGGLHINKTMPDVIIVYLGINDWANGVQVEEERRGFYDEHTKMHVDGYIKGDERVFSVAYRRMLDSLKKNYPSAEVYCCTLGETSMLSNPSFQFPYTYGGTHIERYNHVIRAVAAQYRCKLIDLYDYHVPYETMDGTHPTESGMCTLATLMLRSMCGKEGAAFLDCASSEHEFVSAEEYTGGIKYACQKCGLVDHRNMLFPEDFDELYSGSTVNGQKIQKITEFSNELQEIKAEEKINAPDVIDFDPYSTTMLISADDGIRLFSESRGKEIRICKTQFLAGRSKDSDLQMSSSFIARMHATFMFVGNSWLLRDNDSTNGTWLNETKLIPGKKYVLHPDDVIDFAHTEKFIFFQSNSRQRDKGYISEKSEALIGQKIEDKYLLLRLLGRSGIVKTYMATDSSDRMWAVKVCDKASPNYTEHMRATIMQEAHIMQKFNHPAIPKVEDLIENEKHIAVVRKYIEGNTLHELLVKNGPFRESDVIYYARCLVVVLLYMHKFDPPYIYRDMKPMNVIVTPAGDVKLIDFGICDVQESLKAGIIEEVYGTRGYVAPEQFNGKYDSRTDIYGLGITMHHLVTGISPNEPPYEMPPVRQVRPEISQGMEYIIQKCIALNPDERYQNCEELLLDLNNIQDLPPKRGLFSNLFGKKDR